MRVALVGVTPRGYAGRNRGRLAGGRAEHTDVNSQKG